MSEEIKGQALEGEVGKIKLGEKEYTPTELEGIVGSHAVMGEKVGKVQAILDTCARYNLEPEELLANAMGSFSLINNLMKEGIIDEEGTVLSKTKDKDDPVKSPVAGVPKGLAVEGGGKVDEIVNKALGSALGGINERLEKIQSIQTGMIQADFESKIKAKHPELNDVDIERVLRSAMSDPKKTLWQHAEGIANERKSEREAVLKETAAKLKIPWDVFQKRLSTDENSLEEKSPMGGMAPLIKGKKFSFIKKGDGFIEPKQAAAEFFKRAEAMDRGD